MSMGVRLPGFEAYRLIKSEIWESYLITLPQFASLLKL